ncbi:MULTISPECIES: hypothetical protein [Delftia]|uniref:hypothetical protein n=1 Tax=Delftia TaxID=80865 RepID=UPI000A529348|nr:hypothetical protein [Delftia lacustris]
MTRAARIVLQDAKFAISKHSNTLQSEWFRISWFGIIGLLRSVGHVLDKVDSQISPSMAYAIRVKWAELQKSKPEPSIFWEFIESERNRILKSYEYGIDRNLTVAGPYDDNRGATVVRIDCANSRGGQINPGAPLRSWISTGHYSGKYEKDIAWEAHDWWQSYLDEIDMIATNHSSQPTAFGIG